MEAEGPEDDGRGWAREAEEVGGEGSLGQYKGGDIELRDSNYNTYSLVDAARVTYTTLCIVANRG